MALDDRPSPDAARRLGGGPVITGDAVRFELPDEDGLDGVRLELDFDLGPTDPEFVRQGRRWTLTVPRPAVDRLEYQFTVRRGDRTEWTVDPGNPHTVPNPFGAKSEICFPEYRPPGWLGADPDANTHGVLEEIATDRGRLDHPVPTRLWSPPDLTPDQPAPLLLVHDGSDMAERGSLLCWATRVGYRNRLRVALLDPVAGSRDTWYAANPTYAEHITDVVLPALTERVATNRVIGMGASLGAVAMLLIQRLGALDAAVLQSGSFFTRQLDPQESSYPHFSALCDMVGDVVSRPGPPARVVMTAGTVEENRANNEAMAATLTEQGYPVELRIVRDAHTMIGWRDAWSPAVDELIESMERDA